MKPYKNLGGNSSVCAYEYDDSSIRILFKSRDCYEYKAEKIGMSNLAQMKQLADYGQGLCHFIHCYVKTAFSRKWNIT